MTHKTNEVPLISIRSSSGWGGREGVECTPVPEEPSSLNIWRITLPLRALLAYCVNDVSSEAQPRGEDSLNLTEL